MGDSSLATMNYIKSASALPAASVDKHPRKPLTTLPPEPETLQPNLTPRNTS
jgi:hypothetical protein